MSAPAQIVVLGAGSWGATLAGLLAENGHDVSLWEFDAAAAQRLASTRRLGVLPGLQLPTTVRVTAHIKEALQDRTVIVSATPSHVVRSTMKSVRATGELKTGSMVISVSKGLEEKTLKRMTEVIREETGLAEAHVTVLAGPSHAEEVCRHLPTATVAAGTDPAIVARVQALFTGDAFRVYPHSDVLGVELGGTLKNVYAIASGISDGLGLGDNTRAALLTRGLNEMTRLGVKMGAQLLTFFGLAGMGDLIVTCLSRHSRNYQLGEKIGKGQTPQQALSEMTMVAEGYKTAPSAHALAQRLGLECPLTREIYQVLYEGKKARTSLHDLMARETQTEWQGLPEVNIHEQSPTH